MNEKIQRLKNLVEQSPQRKEIHFLLAEAYFKAEMFEEAKKTYSIAIELDNNYIKAFINLTEILLVENNLEEAEIIITGKLKEGINDIEWLLSFARLYKKYKYYDNSLTFLKKALQYDKKNFIIYCELADIYLVKNEYKLSQQHYRNAISLNPSHLTLYVKLAQAFYIDNEPLKALEALKNGLRIDNNSVEIHYLIAKIYSELQMENDLHNEIEILKLISPERAEEFIRNA